MTTPRRFLLSDAIALVAATAGAIGLLRPYYAAMDPLSWSPTIGGATPFTGWMNGLWGCLVRASPVAMAWTIAVLAMRLRRPRPRWRRLVRQPGFVAGLAAVLVLVGRLAGFATLYGRAGRDPGLAGWMPRHFQGVGCFMGNNPGWMLFDTDHVLGTMSAIGTAIVACWTLLFLGGEWRPERSWVDRAGRALGWFWVLTLPLTNWWDFHARF